MNDLLIFFALPIATIILSIVFQKILKDPLLVSATCFAIYLIITFSLCDMKLIIVTIIFTIISYITAAITKLICNIKKTVENETNKKCIANEMPNNMKTNSNSILDPNIGILSANCWKGSQCNCMRNRK